MLLFAGAAIHSVGPVLRRLLHPRWAGPAQKRELPIALRCAVLQRCDRPANEQGAWLRFVLEEDGWASMFERPLFVRMSMVLIHVDHLD